MCGEEDSPVMYAGFSAIVLFILFRTSNQFDQPSERHSFSTYSFEAKAARGEWLTSGNAIANFKAVQLTADRPGQRGGVWSTQPVPFPFWEVEMEYHVPTKDTVLYGDGLVLWYVKTPNVIGNVFGYKDYFMGMGLFLDTYCNHNGEHNHFHPYVSLMINDGTLHYDHDRDGTHTQAAGCHFPFRHKTDHAFVKLRYVDNTLTLWKRLASEEYSQCFEIAGVELPTGYYFGVTAVTGDLSDEHDVIKFEVTQLNADKAYADRSKITPRAASAEKPREHVDDAKRHSKTWRFIKVAFLACLLLAIILFVVWLVGFYYQERERRQKRFY